MTSQTDVRPVLWKPLEATPPKPLKSSHPSTVDAAPCPLGAAELSTLAQGHFVGAFLSLTTDDADDWPRIWVHTKIALIDSF